MNGECSPLSAAGVKVSILHMEIPRADSLRSETVEKGNLGSTGDAEILAVRILHGLLLLGRLTDDFDPVRGECSQFMSTPVEELDLEFEVFSLVRIADIQSLRRTVRLKTQFYIPKFQTRRSVLLTIFAF